VLHAKVAKLSRQRETNNLGDIRFSSVPVFGRKKTEPIVSRLSPSSIATFRQCKLQYKFRYIDKLGDQYGRARPYYTMANHVHATLQNLFSVVPIQNRTVETATRLLRKNWRRYRVGFRNRADEKRWAQRALDEITRFVAEHDMTITPMMLESPVEARITPGLTLRGRVDRVDRQLDDSLHVIDYKTGLMPETIDWTQLELHALILCRSTRFLVSKVSYLYLLKGAMQTKQLDRQVLDQTSWEVLRIAREVRREKDFLPSPGPACGGCDFTSICPTKDASYTEIGEVELPLWRDFSDILFED
jgi:putative RecB family exonuclease